MARWTIPVDDDAVADLRARLAGTRWPDEINDDAWGWGVDLGYLRSLVDSWLAFDWHARVAELNELPHYLADIEGHPDVAGGGGRALPPPHDRPRLRAVRKRPATR